MKGLNFNSNGFNEKFFVVIEGIDNNGLLSYDNILQIEQ